MNAEQPRTEVWRYLYSDLGGGPVEVRIHGEFGATAECLLDAGEPYTFQGNGTAHPDRQKAREQGLTLHEGGGDADTALLHTANREYETTVGRWLGEDPASFAAEGGDLRRYPEASGELPPPPK